MTKGTMIKKYRKFSAHDAYIVGIERGQYLFMLMLTELMPRWIKLTREATSKGGGAKIKLYINAHDRDLLINTCGVCLGKTKDVLPMHLFKNKGDAFEYLVSVMFDVPPKGSNSIGFWHDGDVTIDGIKYQVKYNTASIVSEQTLKTLKTFKRLGITPPETFTSDINKQLERLKIEKKNQKKTRT